jgi:protease IV
LERLAAVFRWIWRLTAAASILFTVFFFLCLFALLSGVASLHRQGKSVAVPKGCALVLAPGSSILEKRPPFNPAEELAGLLNRAPQRKALLLQDIISGLRKAAKDDRIKLLLITPDQLEQAGLNQLRDIGQAIAQFRAAGKRVITAADSYSQGQYYLAAWSDEIYLNPMGSVDLHGFGLFNLYLRELLDKLEITFHVFRVGAFKAAVEPLLRKDMSPEAKENNLRWLNRLWAGYCRDVAVQRRIPPQAVADAAERLAENMEAAGGDAAMMAKTSKLVDGLKTSAELREHLRHLVGGSEDNEEGFNRIDFSDYLNAVGRSWSKPLPKQDHVAILIAQGDIIYGEGGEGQIGSGELAGQLRKLRQDKHVKAVVLRIDSGGGSAFASELIRQELLLTKKAGKPVVVSMGSAAASGGYWIAANADRVFASPYTITGSIGIFGAFPTIEKTLAKVGIFSDGIGTTGLAGAGSVVRPLPEAFSRAMQSQIELGYRRFIDLVADGRKLSREDVEKIAGGRVWDGASAFELGLTDKLGSLEDAVTAAAQLAGLPEDQAAYVEDEASPAEIFLRSVQTARLASSPLMTRAEQFISQFTRRHDFLFKGDPQHIYSHCMLPELMQE